MPVGKSYAGIINNGDFLVEARSGSPGLRDHQLL